MAQDLKAKMPENGVVTVSNTSVNQTYKGQKRMLVLSAICSFVCFLPTRCDASWMPLGTPLLHDAIWAAGIDYNQTTMTPFLAYGYENFTRAGVTILFSRFDTRTNSWLPVATHESQFAQQYDHFALRVRSGIPYLALRIDSIGLSSILRGRGGWDGFDGCWAFDGFAFDAEINSAGDARMVTSPDNATLALETYNHTGWDSYPAGDAWGPPTTIIPAGGAAPGTVDDIVVVAGDTAADALFAIYAVNGGVAALRTTMSNTSTVTHLANGSICCMSADDGTSAAWNTPTVLHAKFPTGLLCVATIGNSTSSEEARVDASSGQLSVSCIADPGAATNNVWFSLGQVTTALVSRGVTAIAIANTTIIAAGIDVTDPSRVRVGVCNIIAISTPPGVACANNQWGVDDIQATQPVSIVELRNAPLNGATNGDVLLLVTEGTRTGSDTLAVYRRST